MPGIQTNPSLGGDLKLRRLARRLRSHCAQAIGHLHYLWWWALGRSPTGDLSGLTPEEIGLVAQWPGQPEAFLAALKDCGWIDPEGHLLDWPGAADGRQARERESNRRRQERWRQRQRDRPPPDRYVTRYVTSPVTVTNASVTPYRKDNGSLSPESEPFWPTLTDCLGVAEARGLPAGCAEKWWREHDARGGRDRHGQPLQRWESNLLAYAVAWRANDDKARQNHENRSRSAEGRPNRNAGTYNEAVVGQYANAPGILRA